MKRETRDYLEWLMLGIAIVFSIMGLLGCSTPRGGTITDKQIGNPMKFMGHKVPVDYQEIRAVHWLEINGDKWVPTDAQTWSEKQKGDEWP